MSTYKSYMAIRANIRNVAASRLRQLDAHPDEFDLAEFVVDSEEGSGSPAIAQHVSQCAGCSSEVQRLQAVSRRWNGEYGDRRLEALSARIRRAAAEELARQTSVQEPSESSDLTTADMACNQATSAEGSAVGSLGALPRPSLPACVEQKRGFRFSRLRPSKGALVFALASAVSAIILVASVKASVHEPAFNFGPTAFDSMPVQYYAFTKSVVGNEAILSFDLARRRALERISVEADARAKQNTMLANGASAGRPVLSAPAAGPKVANGQAQQPARLDRAGHNPGTAKTSPPPTHPAPARDWGSGAGLATANYRPLDDFLYGGPPTGR